MTNLRGKTEEYIKAFDNKNLEEVSKFFNQDSILFDPANPRGVKGKNNIMAMIDGIFKDHDRLSFVDKNIFIDQNTSIIEFEIALNEKKLVGVDLIEWDGSFIKELRAYLY
ncbi:nuclear transport factor 2 family protein [Rickettsiales bacterium]|nr:nuclear transport factor 2 family protein [Rickettsiales bacterium]